MIDQTFNFLKNGLNSFLVSHMDLQPSDRKVNISGLIKQDGKFHEGFESDSVSLVLTSIQEETAYQPVKAYIEKNNKTHSTSRTIFFNLHVLTVFHFSVYEESLKFLSATLQYFQSNPSFNSDNSVSFEIDGIEKINVKLISQTQEQQNHLWGTLGAKYMPSLLYKVSLLQLSDSQIKKEIPSVRSIDYSLTKKYSEV